MASKNSFLKQLELLHSLGFHAQLEPGMTVARGFADLGYEEFSLLRSNLMISLYTGKEVSITEEDRKHIFSVLSCDDLVQEISRAGFDITEVCYHEQREWQMQFQRADNSSSHQVRGETLQEALLEGLVTITRITSDS